MPGTIIERLSNRKLGVVIATIALIQVVSFLIGAIIAPSPSNTEQLLAIKCIPDDPKQLAIPRYRFKPTILPKNCRQIHDPSHVNGSVVFAFQLPLPREGIELDYSRWMSNLLTLIIPEMTYAPWMGKAGLSKAGNDYINGTLHMKVRLAVKKEDGEWHEYAVKEDLKRYIKCWIPESKRVEGYRYDCDIIQLFDLQSLYYDFYLINIQFTGGLDAEQHFGLLSDLNLVAIHANGGFTKIWLSMKTFFTVITLATLIWFSHRLSQLKRPWTLLEKTIAVLGIALTQLNIPLEFLSLWVDFPFNHFLSDLRQGILYCSLFSFWVIFTGEHLMDGVSRSRIASYWKPLSIVLVASISLFVFDSLERGIQGYDPFFTVWEVDSTLATLFLVVAGAASISFFFYLTYHIYLVLANISSKRNTLPSMSMTRRMIYQGVIFRFQFLLLATLACAALTLAAFLIGQWSEDAGKFDFFDITSGEGGDWEWTSGMFSTVYAMWNCYVITLLILYAPSHKESSTDLDHLSEEVEFSRLNPSTPSTSNGTHGSTGNSGHRRSERKSNDTSPVEETSGMKLLQDLVNKQAFD